MFQEFAFSLYGDGMARGRRISEERSDDILGAVLELLHAQGYDQLRMQDVADRAGVGPSPYYRRRPSSSTRRPCAVCRWTPRRWPIASPPCCSPPRPLPCSQSLGWSRRKRSTSSAMDSAVGRRSGSSSWRASSWVTYVEVSSSAST